jgi:hypothetical protein
MQRASFRKQRRRWGSASGLPSLELRHTKLVPVPCLAVLVHSGHLGICTALPINTWTHSAIGDAGPRRMAWTVTIRLAKEVAVYASLTNGRRLLSLAGDLSTTTQELP